MGERQLVFLVLYWAPGKKTCSLYISPSKTLSKYPDTDVEFGLQPTGWTQDMEMTVR